MKPKEFCWKGFFKLFGKELFVYIIIYIIAAMLLARAFFERWMISCIITACGLPIFLLEIKKCLTTRRQARIEAEFFIMLQQVSMSLSSGSTLENAVRETIVTDRRNYKTIGEDLECVYRMLRNNYPPEDAFRIFAQRCRNREILTFSEVLAVGIPAGINLAQLIRYLSSAYRLKADVEQEIKKTLNAPKYNNRIIMAMPVCCIFLFRKIAPSYLEPLYHGSGRIVMAAVFLLLLAAWWTGKYFSNIRY